MGPFWIFEGVFSLEQRTQGSVTIQSEGELHFLGPSANAIYSLTLTNHGTIRHRGGAINHGSSLGTHIVNHGNWIIEGDFLCRQTIGGPASTWTNTGTLTKSTGSGIAQIVNFDMALGGIVQVDSGILSLRGEGTRTLSATSFIAENAILELNGGDYADAGGLFLGPGNNNFTSGTLTLRTNSLPGLNLRGGTVTIADSFQQNGAITNLTLNGSILEGSTHRVGNGTLSLLAGGITGSLTIEPQGTLLIDSPSATTFYSLILTNHGTVRHLNGDINHGNSLGTHIFNHGNWVIAGDVPFRQTIGGPSSTWINTGTLSKSVGSGTAQLSSLIFSNAPSGIVRVASGTFTLPSDTLHSAGTIQLLGGTVNLPGNSVFSGGTLEGDGFFSGKTFTGGTIQPGGANQIGTLHFLTGLVLNPNTIVSMDLLGPIPATQYDQIQVTGSVVLSNAQLQLRVPTPIPFGQQRVLILNDQSDPVAGQFLDKPQDALFDTSQQFLRINYAASTGNDIGILGDDGFVRITPHPQPNLGSFEIRGLGTNSVTYSIYASPVVPASTWSLIGTAKADDSGHFTFQDPDAWLFPHRFYRSLGLR